MSFGVHQDAFNIFELCFPTDVTDMLSLWLRRHAQEVLWWLIKIKVGYPKIIEARLASLRVSEVA